VAIIQFRNVEEDVDFIAGPGFEPRSMGPKPSELGYDKTYMYRVRHGLVPISDELFKALLRFIDVDEYARLVGSAPQLVDATPDDIVRVVKKALVDRSFRDLLFDRRFRQKSTTFALPLVNSTGLLHLMALGSTSLV
jgi:hypothetical protein